MKQYTFNNVSKTYILYASGIYLIHDLRYELTDEAIVEGINDFLLFRQENGEPFTLFGGKAVEYNLNQMVNYLNQVYFKELYNPLYTEKGVILEYLVVNSYSYIMLDDLERDMITFYALAYDNKEKAMFVSDIEKDHFIPSVKDFYGGLKKVLDNTD